MFAYINLEVKHLDLKLIETGSYSNNL